MMNNNIEIPNKMYIDRTGEQIRTPENVKNFLEDLIALYKKYNLSILHEDHGGFIIANYSDYATEWMLDCNLDKDSF